MPQSHATHIAWHLAQFGDEGIVHRGAATGRTDGEEVLGYLGLLLLCLLVIAFVPALTLWLPHALGY